MTFNQTNPPQHTKITFTQTQTSKYTRKEDETTKMPQLPTENDKFESLFEEQKIAITCPKDTIKKQVQASAPLQQKPVPAESKAQQSVGPLEPGANEPPAKLQILRKSANEAPKKAQSNAHSKPDFSKTVLPKNENLQEKSLDVLLDDKPAPVLCQHDGGRAPKSTNAQAVESHCRKSKGNAVSK